MQDHSKYTRTARTVIGVAEKGFFDSLRWETKEVVYFLMQCICLTDDYIDSLKGTPMAKAMENILEFLDGKAVLAVTEPETFKSLVGLKAALDCVSKEQKTTFLAGVSSIFASGKKLVTTTDPKEFVTERSKEGKGSADMVLALATELGSNDKFSAFFRELAIAINLFDSIEDIRQDRIDGNLAIKPIKLYFSLAAGTFKHTKAAIKAHPKKLTMIRVGLLWALEHFGLKARPLSPAHDRVLQPTPRKRYEIV